MKLYKLHVIDNSTGTRTGCDPVADGAERTGCVSVYLSASSGCDDDIVASKELIFISGMNKRAENRIVFCDYVNKICAEEEVQIFFCQRDITELLRCFTSGRIAAAMDYSAMVMTAFSCYLKVTVLVYVKRNLHFNQFVYVRVALPRKAPQRLLCCKDPRLRPAYLQHDCDSCHRRS